MRDLRGISADFDITFCYVSAKDYSLGDPTELKWLSKGVSDVRSVLGYPGKTIPTRKLHLIVLAGFEPDRAQNLISEYEPAKLSIGLGDPEESISPELYQINEAFHKRLTEQLAGVQKFTFSCLHPDKTAEAISREANTHRGFNTVVAPMNTKLSTVGAGLAAMANDEIQLCYAAANLYNEEKYSSVGDHCYLFHLEQ